MPASVLIPQRGTNMDKKPISPRPVEVKPILNSITIGYHSITLELGQSVSINDIGNIVINYQDGRCVDTGKNVNTAPPTFHGAVLGGDMKEISRIDRQAYVGKHVTIPPDVKHCFEVWQNIFILNKKARFTPFSTGGQTLWAFTLPSRGYTLVATSEHPAELLYILAEGRKYYYQAEINTDIPETSLYVQDVIKAKRDYLTAESKAKLAAMPMTEAQLSADEELKNYWIRAEKKSARLALRLEKEAVEKELARKNQPATSNNNSLVSMGVLPLSAYHEEYVNKPILSKDALFKMAQKVIKERNSKLSPEELMADFVTGDAQYDEVKPEPAEENHSVSRKERLARLKRLQPRQDFQLK